MIKHTPEDHADYGPLVEAQEKIHKLALKIDRAEKEMMHQEQLKDLESLIDGNINLQNQQRGFIRYDLVTILNSSSSLNMARKERVLFLICDLLIITSVKKKASRRSNLQSAFANSYNDLSLLEGNKFKLIVKFSIDQVDVRIDNDEIHKLRLKHHKLIQARHREIELDLDILNQIKSMSANLKHINQDDISSVTDRLCGQLRDRLILLTQDDGLTHQLNNSQDFHINVPLSQLQDTCSDTIPISSQQQQQQQHQTVSSSSGVSNSQQQSSMRNSSLSHSSSMGSSQDSNAEIEFIIYNNQPSREIINQSGSIDIPDPNEPVVIATNDQIQLDQFETLLVAFGSPERRQAFLQAFLDLKKQRKQMLGQLAPKQPHQQKVFSSSASFRSIEPVKNSRFQQPDQVSMIPPLSPHIGLKIQHSIQPNTSTMRHQLSEPHSLSLMNQSSELSAKDSSSVIIQGQELIACQNSNNFERTQQATSHPALVCCKNFHPDRFVYQSKSDRSSPRPFNRLMTEDLNLRVPLNRENTLDNSDLSQIESKSNPENLRQSFIINDQRSLIRSAPRFLSALPLNFFNTNQCSLSLSCSTQTYIETESAQNKSHQNTSGEFWLCLSNGYASHIALISMIRSDTSLVQNIGLPPSVPKKHRCLMIPILNSGGDICKSLITCAAQVKWPTGSVVYKTPIEVSIKPASPPMDNLNPTANQTTTSRHNTVPLTDLRRALQSSSRSNLSTTGAYLTDPISSDSSRELKTTRSATPPSALRVGAKSFRSAKLLRHQASLRTNSIIAKLVGVSSRRYSNPKKHRQRTEINKTNEKIEKIENNNNTNETHNIENSSIEHRDFDKNKVDNFDANSISALTMPGSSKQMMDNSGGSDGAHRGVVSPLSSISSFNSATNSSMTINSVCTSSPNRSSTNLFHSYSATSCDKAFSYHPTCVGGSKKADLAIRNRSATVPSRAFCDQRRNCPSPSCQRSDLANEIKVCDLSTGFVDVKSSNSHPNVDNSKPANIESSSALWLGCSDGTIIIMNCLVNNVQSTNCNLCDLNQRNLNCDNVHSEINLGFAINDIR